MLDPFNKLAKILWVQPEALLELDRAMTLISGKKEVLAEITAEFEKNIFGGGLDLIMELDKKLAWDWNGQLPQAALKVYRPPAGFFIKKEKIIELFNQYPPENISFKEEDIYSVISALRFTQTTEWMHQFFDRAYGRLTAADFGERGVEIITLEPKWFEIATKFQKKKFHNISHLKEHGIIFIIPDQSGQKTEGEVLRNFLLILHYLHEVPFYSKLFKRFSDKPDFTEKLKSLLRGDVMDITDARSIIRNKNNWLIIQRYLAKDDPNDPRLFMPHVNPEAEHWHLVGQDLGLAEAELDLAGVSKWRGTDWLDNNLVDSVMTAAGGGKTKHLYHQKEALWNRIFAGHFGREEMNRLIEENIVKGYITL